MFCNYEPGCITTMMLLLCHSLVRLVMLLGDVKGKKAFLIEYTTDPITADSVWQFQNSATCKTTISGLEVGKKYWIRITVIGKGQQTATCDPVLTKVIQ